MNFSILLNIRSKCYSLCMYEKDLKTLKNHVPLFVCVFFLSLTKKCTIIGALIIFGFFFFFTDATYTIIIKVRCFILQ